MSTQDEATHSAEFANLALPKNTLENLKSLGYHSMTPIQAQSLPPILEGRDVLAQAKTGSGKTAAFGLGLLNKIDVSVYRVQVLVLCPTRELADQVAKELRRLARSTHNIKVLTLYGGTAFGPQVGSLEHGAHIIVGTPGRIEDHLRKKTLQLDQVHTLVLDEADRMLDMGFQDTLDKIILQVPDQRQTLLFSATYPEEIQSIAKRIMVKPVIVQVTATHDNATIEQHFYCVDEMSRTLMLRLLIMQHQPVSTLVFCNTKRECQDLADDLRGFGFSVAALHGDLEQRDRDQTLVQFANKSVSVLVATDVAARGLDIDALDLVINYHLAHDVEMHVHRIGRTGRAGSVGIACTLFSSRELHKMEALESYLKQDIEPTPLPPPSLLERSLEPPPMVTLLIDGGRKQKVRPGDILGALTSDGTLGAADVGKIDIFTMRSYVAVRQPSVKAALRKLGQGKLKGRSFRIRRLRT